MTKEQWLAVADAARRLLAQQLEREPYVPGFTQMAIDSFMRSYDVDPSMSRPLLERLLNREHLAEYGRYELPHLARAIDMVHDADALYIIYRVVFSDVTLGTGPVAVGPPSVGLNLTQDAAQCLSMSQSELARHFEVFLDEHPAEAIGALASALNVSLPLTSLIEGPVFSCTINGRMVQIASDLSQFNDSDHRQDANWWIMVSAFEERLRASIAAGDMTFFDAALQVLPAETTGSFLWRVVLRASGANATSAAALLPFVTTRSLLESSEFGSPLRDYFATAFLFLDEPKKEIILATLLEYVMDDCEGGLRRDRCDRARALVAKLPEGILENHPLGVVLQADANTAESIAGEDDEASALLDGFQFRPLGIRPIALSDAAREAGADPALITVLDALEMYVYQNPRKLASLPRPVVDVIEVLNRLSQMSTPAARRATLEVMWMIMRDALTEQVAMTPETVRDWKTIALEMIAEPPPAWSADEQADRERRYAKSAYLTTRAREEGVEILYILFSRIPSPEILQALRPLGEDVDPAIRAAVAYGARWALQAAPDEAWAIIERGFSDSNVGVWVAALQTTRYAQSNRQDRVHSMYLDAFTRIENIEHREDFCIQLARAAIDLAFHFNHPGARERVTEVVVHPWTFPRRASCMVFELANTVADPATEWERRVSSAELLLPLIVGLVDETERLQHLYGFDLDAYPPANQSQARTMLKLLHDASQRLYYSSQIQRRAAPNAAFENTGSVSAQGYALLRPIIVAFRRLPFPSVAYNVIRLLQGAIDIDPRDVLLLGCGVIKGGGQSGLAADGQAEPDVRSFVMRYVQHHRGLLEADRECLGVIMDVVDLFVNAGHPNWISIVAELDGIYRSS